MSKKETAKKAEGIVKGNFSLDNFKLKKGFSGNSVKFKEQQWIPLSPAFQEVTSLPGIPTGHITLLRGHSDTGKAQPLTSNILTPDGWVKMGDIKVGDEVIGSDGSGKSVLGVYPQGQLQVYEVHFSDGSVVETCGEHLWEVETYKDRRSNSSKKRRLEKLGKTNEYERRYSILTTDQLQEDIRITPYPTSNPDKLIRNYKVKGIKNLDKKEKYVDKVTRTDRFVDMQCIYINSEDHLYVTDGYTLTHNTTALLEAAVNAQMMGILPVFIITEMKWSWEHAKEMGLEFEPIVDETGTVVDYKGFFLYADRGRLNTIEDVAVFIADLIDEQNKGNLPHDLCFFWDSIGSVPCELSVRSNKNNNEWNAGAMSTQFGNNLNQKILLSRKEGSKYTNTLVAINKVWTMKPESPMGQPKLSNKGGMAMWYDATMVYTFGNITNPGTSKIKAIKAGKQVEFAKRTNIQVEKNHISGVTTRGKIVMTQHGFIEDTPKAVEAYKNAYKDHWLNLLGSVDFDLIEEGDMEENLSDIGLTDE